MVQQLKEEGTKAQVVVSGAAAGLLSRFVIAPLDVIKIRLQLQIHSLSDPLSRQGVRGPTYSGFFGTLKEILREEGLTVSFHSPLTDLILTVFRHYGKVMCLQKAFIFVMEQYNSSDIGP
jgi:hypothetical protein